MPVMSSIESASCRSAPWQSFAGRKVLPWALDGHPLSDDVLEIGGGGGAMAAGVASTFPDLRLTVTDVDIAMVDAARSRLSPYRNVTSKVADVTSMPFADASFDAVTSYLMLHHVIDWNEALVETARVLRPGGAIVGYDLTETRIARWVHKADGSPHRLITAAELVDGLAEAGFTEISVRRSFAGHVMRFQARTPAGR